MPHPLDPWFERIENGRIADYYDLLDLPRFESDYKLIVSAAKERYQYLKGFAEIEATVGQGAGSNPKVLMGQLKKAAKTLTDADAKRAYDLKLGHGSPPIQAATKPVVETVETSQPAIGANAPKPFPVVVDSDARSTSRVSVNRGASHARQSGSSSDEAKTVLHALGSSFFSSRDHSDCADRISICDLS